jgi:peptidoglycan/xylan/chitin deacetylase (PgdA/CDA1 family)
MILMYHRVADPELDPWQLCVRPSHFEEQLGLLRDRDLVVSLDQVAEGALEDEPAVVLTLDDGYADTASHALPILDRHGMPMTVYVTTGGLRCASPYWWDELGELVLRPGRLPRHVPGPLRSLGLEAIVEQAADYSPTEAERCARWTAEHPPPTARHALYLTLWRRMVGSQPREREHLLAAVRDWAGRDGSPSALPISEEGLAALRRHHLVTIGAHTERHPALTALDEQARTREIVDATRDLEARTSSRVEHFAYPHGRHDDDVTSIVRAAGFRTAVTTDGGLVRPRTDRFRLPRWQVPDYGGDLFGSWLDRILAGRW